MESPISHGGTSLRPIHNSSVVRPVGQDTTRIILCRSRTNRGQLRSRRCLRSNMKCGTLFTPGEHHHDVRRSGQSRAYPWNCGRDNATTIHHPSVWTEVAKFLAPPEGHEVTATFNPVASTSTETSVTIERQVDMDTLSLPDCAGKTA